MDQSSETGLPLSTTLLLLGKDTTFQKGHYWNETQILLASNRQNTGAFIHFWYICFEIDFAWSAIAVLTFYLADCRSKDSRYDDMGHLESNNNKPMDKPLNLETKSERRLSSTDKDSGNTHYVLALSLCAKLNINLFFFLLIRDDKF